MENLKIDFGQNSAFFGDRKILLEELKVKLKNEFVFDYENFSFFEIEKLNLSVFDVRQAIDFANKTSEGKKIILLSSFYWMSGAQNALLKILEESPENTYFFLFGPSKKVFLPTVLSRLQKYDCKGVNRFAKEAAATLALEPFERLDSKIVKKILSLKVVDIDYKKNTENEKKDRESHILFLSALVNLVLEKSELRKDKEFLEKIVSMSEFMDIEGGSPHLFVEWLLLSVPRIEG